MAISTVKDIMTSEVISVHPETSILEAHKLISDHNFHGVPVVDEENRILGILTEYDLIAKGSSMHLPTFQKIVSELNFEKNHGGLENDIEALAQLRVSDVMNSEPLTLSDTASFEEVVEVFRSHHRVNPVPVINNDKKVVGIVSHFDILQVLFLKKNN